MESTCDPLTKDSGARKSNHFAARGDGLMTVSVDYTSESHSFRALSYIAVRELDNRTEIAGSGPLHYHASISVRTVHERAFVSRVLDYN